VDVRDDAHIRCSDRADGPPARIYPVFFTGQLDADEDITDSDSSVEARPGQTKHLGNNDLARPPLSPLPRKYVTQIVVTLFFERYLP
jgi:hypothetical protein